MEILGSTAENGFINIGTKTGDVDNFFFLSLALSESYN